MDQKSIKKRKQKGRRFEHRFLIDFGGFWVASWGAKWKQNGQKRHRKNDEKEGQQDGVLERFGVAPGAATYSEGPRRATSVAKTPRPGAPEPPHFAPDRGLKTIVT